MSEFYEIQPSKENYWRSIILFGRNVASYKFALAKALYDVKTSGHSVVTLDQLAVPFSRYICEHLQLVDKQATSQSSKFLDVCRAYNRNEIDQTMLINKTVQYGFVNVIDAFHCVHVQEIPQRFFSDARKTYQGIILTGEIFQLFDAQKPVNGVANLVLACAECNRGQNGKFDRLPSVNLLVRLHKRNEYLITSHHPLRETLIAQTGFTEIARRGFLQSAYECATHHLGMAYKWQPKQNGHSAF